MTPQARWSYDYATHRELGERVWAAMVVENESGLSLRFAWSAEVVDICREAGR